MANLHAGQTVTISNLVGKIQWGQGEVSCRDGLYPNEPKQVAIGQFTDDNNQVVAVPGGGVADTNAILLRSFENGIKVPAGATRLYGSFPDSRYNDNSGQCDMTVVGSLSLLLCSQFGMGRGYNLMHAFMSYGAFTCMAFCGALFLGLTVVVAGFFLSNPELKRIRSTAYAPIVFLGLMSLVVLFCFGAEIALNLALFWLFGALLAGMLLTELSLSVRQIAAHRA
jgi:hypothetical protein